MTRWAGLSDENEAQRRVGSRDARRIDRTKRQEKFIALVAEGTSIKDACAQLPIARKTYEGWRRDDVEFKVMVDTIRMRRLDEAELTPSDWDGTFITGRKIFFEFDSYFHQREIIHAIEKANPGEVTLILVAPETGKTTVLEDWMCLKLGQDPNRRVTYVSEGQGRTRKIAGRLQRRMTVVKDYEKFIQRFGPFYMRGQERQGKPWASDYFTVWRADHDERDFSFEGRGWRSAVAGTRTDDLLIDDVQSLRSLNQSADIVDRLRQDFFSRPGREGRISIVGTRVGNGDVYERLQDEGIVTRTVILPIINRNGESLCPEMWPLDALANKRNLVGEDAWWRNYMQQPRASMDAAFTEAMVDGAWDITRKIRNSRFPDRVCTIDPALSGGNGIVVAGYDENHFEVIDIDYAFNLARVEEIIVRVERFAARYGFQHLIVETNAYQKGLAEDERLRELGRRYGFRILPHMTGLNKLDADLGVGRMPVSFIKNEMSFPGADAESREVMHAMVEQLVTWRADIPTKKRRQDLVMALWFGWLFWMNRRKSMGHHTKTIRAASLPWRPMQRVGGTPIRRAM